MKKKILLAFMLCVMSFTVFAGCGNDAGKDQREKQEEKTEVETEQTESDEKVTADEEKAASDDADVSDKEETVQNADDTASNNADAALDNGDTISNDAAAENGDVSSNEESDQKQADSEESVDAGAKTDTIVLDDALREKLAQHYESVFRPAGAFVCFDIDDEVTENGYRTAIRYQMSDGEVEEAMANGGEVLPNRYAFTIEINTSNGNVQIIDMDPFCDWSAGKDFKEYDWNLNAE